MCFQVCVHPPFGKEKIFELCDNKQQLKNITGRQFKEKICKELWIKDDFRIVVNAKPVEEEATLESTGIEHMSTVHTVLKLSGGTSDEE